MGDDTHAVVASNGSDMSTTTTTPFTLKALVTIRRRYVSNMSDTFESVDKMLSNRKIFLQLVSADIDPNTGSGKRSPEIVLESRKVTLKDNTILFLAEVKIDSSFGIPGAILVTNNLQDEFYLECISISGFNTGTITFPCYSWVHSQQDDCSERVFFSNQAYLPSQTPAGMKDLRVMDLKSIQGNGKGERKAWERVYDYDVYNDLGNPDKDKSLIRPTLGGNKQCPYPRRCRTGRPPCMNDPTVESRLPVLEKIYVPRDEDFEHDKAQFFAIGRLKALVHRLMPSIITYFSETPDEFDGFLDIDRLYYEGIELTVEKDEQDKSFWDYLPFLDIVKRVVTARKGVAHVLQFPLPERIQRDKFAWMRDSEFGRQMLAGMNPIRIEKLKVFPPTSQWDEKDYGPLASALKTEHIEPYIEGMTIEEAIRKEKLFIVDYHDIFLPFVNKINAMSGHKTYATRTILYFDSTGLLLPIAIELSLPVSEIKVQGSKRVFCPGNDSTSFWLWQLAKAHVSANHCGYHQLVSHWLRSHACVEPYIIATHRQLSFMHPINKLLAPHLRYTMEINAAARQTLICGNGIIERCFTPGPYAMEMSAAAYGLEWRFDTENLPSDLIRRGMAVEDTTSPHGLRLVIEDYPYASDGLLIWSAIKSWVQNYISIYYDVVEDLTNDVELQLWWADIKNQGHADKKDEQCWPKLDTIEDIVHIVSTIIWVTSAHHAAVNFGQFLYGGYVPNLPSVTRKLIPEENDVEYKDLCDKPEAFFLATIPNQVQATTVMAVLELLSTHSPDEEYIGQRLHMDWSNDNAIQIAFQKFSDDINASEVVIKERNNNPKLKNRYGIGIPPYELLSASSASGMTGRGIPNSISI